MITKRKIDQLENKFFATCEERTDCSGCPYDHYGDNAEDCRNGFIAENLEDYIKTSQSTFKILKEVDPLKVAKHHDLKSKAVKNPTRQVRIRRLLHLLFFIGGLLLLESIDFMPLRILFEGLFIIINYEFIKFKAFIDIMCNGTGAKSQSEIHNAKIELIESILDNNIDSYQKKIDEKEGTEKC